MDTLLDNKFQYDRNFLDMISGFPCGVLRCTFDLQPSVLYANEWMLSFLNVNSDSSDWQDFIQKNLFFMIPSEQRQLFRTFLTKAEQTKNPVCIEHEVVNSTGTRTRLMGWVRQILNSKGGKELLFLYIPFPQEQIDIYQNHENAFIYMLENSYDSAFRMEFKSEKSGIVECLFSDQKHDHKACFVRGMRLLLNQTATENYLRFIYKDDRNKIIEFLSSVEKRSAFLNTKTCKTVVRSADNGILREIQLIATELDCDTVLLCTKDVTDSNSAQRRVEELKFVKSVNAPRKEQGLALAQNIAAFRQLNQTVFLQSSSDSFLPDEGVSLKNFLCQHEISEDEYSIAVSNGMVVLNHSTDSPAEIRHLYIKKSKTAAESCEEYLWVVFTYARSATEHNPEKPRVSIRTFGYFDILVDGKPIVFRHDKSKEMLALMVDRKGSFVGNPYFISCLWEDEPYSEKIQSRCRQTAFRMMETLKQYGIDNIIEKVNGHRRIIPEMVDCDYFSYLSGEKDAAKAFKGAYMSDYSWGEETLSTLLRDTAIQAAK